MEMGMYDEASPGGEQSGERTPKTNRQGGNIRGRAFSIKEDELLCRSWLADFQEPVASPGQKCGTFWNRVCEHFNRNKDWEHERSESSLIHRFSTINLSVSKFCVCFAQLENINQGETEEVDKIDEAKSMYLDTQKRMFTLEHCWRILHGTSKYEEYLRRPPTKKPKDTQHDASTNFMFPTTPMSGNSEMDDYVTVGEAEKMTGYNIDEEEDARYYEDLQQTNMNGYENVGDCEDLEQTNMNGYEDVRDYEDLQHNDMGGYEDLREHGDLLQSHKRGYEDIRDDDVQQQNKRLREDVRLYGDAGPHVNEDDREDEDTKQNILNECTRLMIMKRDYEGIRDDVDVKLVTAIDYEDAKNKNKRVRDRGFKDILKKILDQNQALLERVKRKEEMAIRRDAEQNEREQRKEDDMIMRVDISAMNEIQKRYYAQRQAEIVARLNLIPHP
ncbi:hypothetical protein GIB67_031257 [Kingdonia uniflora]|uniref:No apical meristem-associated C-terminal domain-containing protein n=1 Tax=Kingdonia uniflora TaxID=39325 RepID=A0A7J7NYW2_9MAGN|nr:hypothetical protein GIB67_031257 [Kingdonia uniflora]